MPRASLTRTVLSALVEDPQLFAHPLPPLRELLPKDLRPQDSHPGVDRDLQPRQYGSYAPYSGSSVPEGGDVVQLDSWAR